MFSVLQTHASVVLNRIHTPVNISYYAVSIKEPQTEFNKHLWQNNKHLWQEFQLINKISTRLQTQWAYV